MQPLQFGMLGKEKAASESEAENEDEEKAKVVNSSQKDGLHDGHFPSNIFSLLATPFSGGYDLFCWIILACQKII